MAQDSARPDLFQNIRYSSRCWTHRCWNHRGYDSNGVYPNAIPDLSTTAERQEAAQAIPRLTSALIRLRAGRSVHQDRAAAHARLVQGAQAAPTGGYKSAPSLPVHPVAPHVSGWSPRGAALGTRAPPAAIRSTSTTCSDRAKSPHAAEVARSRVDEVKQSPSCWSRGACWSSTDTRSPNPWSSVGLTVTEFNMIRIEPFQKAAQVATASNKIN
ncbi:uncharacterized protein LOC117084538 [Trachypithecus francoisi]|uniref:uncharacterized protein LOC117084538 n=1 Tax=Trachypithecus francoisi TaxID=54180 RepID=UPI00141AC6C2|nr:uncharacterized protein LOC117084538 [Trachypithecus francoisi]